MNNGVTVDASQVLRMFSELNSRQQKNVYKNALRKAGRILQKETKTQLRSVVDDCGRLFFHCCLIHTERRRGIEFHKNHLGKGRQKKGKGLYCICISGKVGLNYEHAGTN